MKAYEHLRAKAVELRTERNMALDEICERLGLGKSTVYYWIKDIPFDGKRRSPRQVEGQRKGTRTSSEKYRKLREQAYQEAWESAEEELQDSRLRDFVILYMAEGFKRSRNKVEICNSDPAIVQLAHEQITRRAHSKVSYALQCHVDNDEHELKQYWANLLGIDPAAIRVIRKSNSGGLNGRQWRSIHGVLAVSTNDTYFRARLQAWLNYVRGQWGGVVAGPGGDP